MKDFPKFKKIFESAMVGLLNNWRVWCGNDELRAIHIGFDSTNTEVSVSLLTDREPYLEEQKMEPFGKRWPAADWRLTCVNETYSHRFPDAAELLDWMEGKSEELDDEKLDSFNQHLKSMFFEVVTGETVKAQILRFRKVSSPLRIRVEWFFDNKPLDSEIT